MTVRVAVVGAPVPSWVSGAVERGGGCLVPGSQAEAVVWLGLDPHELGRWLDAHTDVQWVQLVHAGIEAYESAFDSDHVWTCAKAAFSDAVAEHGLTLALALLKGIPAAATATTWQRVENRSLLGADVLILGGGGIARSLMRILKPFDVRCTIVRRTGAPLSGAERTVCPDKLRTVLPTADAVFLALSLTAQTRGIIGREELAAMKQTAILVNLARGSHVVTDELVAALQAGAIFGAGLDVTDPEPLPDGHPLWESPRAIITSHSANSADMYDAALALRVEENVRRFGRGERLLGEMDINLGY